MIHPMYRTVLLIHVDCKTTTESARRSEYVDCGNSGCELIMRIDRKSLTKQDDHYNNAIKPKQVP